jgi:sulfite exporter TauE/SafE
MFSSFLIGLLGGLGATAHCLGMCGGFPLHLSRASQRVPAFVRQCLYVAGKAFTYAFLGTLFGAIGSQLVASGWLPSAQKYLAWGGRSCPRAFRPGHDRGEAACSGFLVSGL